MGKAALLSKLGMHAEAKAHKSQATRRKAIAFNATKEGGDSSVKKAQIKGRILRSVKRGITAEEKKQGRKLTQEEKRTVAGRALAVEVKAIRSGTPENKGRQKGDLKKMSVVAGGQKTKGKSGANLTSVEGGSQSLQDLFKSADRIGNKYQDGNDPADLGAKRAAKQMRQETGVASLVDQATGGSRLRAIDGGKGKKPATVSDIGSAHSAQIAAMDKRSLQRAEEAKGKKSSFSHTPPPGVSVAEHRANLRRQYGAMSGTRNENLSKKEERRSEIGRGDEGESRIRKSEVADRVTEPKGEQGKAAISKELQRMVAERESGKQQGMISANDHQTLFQFKNMGDLDSQATDKVKQTAARVLGVHHSEIKELTRTSVGLNVRLRNESKPSFISESATRPRQIEVRDEKAIKKEAKRLLDEAKTVARERIAARESANLPTPKTNPQYKYEEYTPHEQQLAKIHTRAELEKMHGKLLGAQPGNSASHLRAIEKSTSMQSNSQARAQSGNVVRGNYEQRQFYNHALEIHDHYPEKSKQPDRVTEPEKAKDRSRVLSLEESDQVRKDQQNDRGRFADFGRSVLSSFEKNNVQKAYHRGSPHLGVFAPIDIGGKTRLASHWFTMEGKRMLTTTDDKGKLIDVSVTADKQGKYKRLSSKDHKQDSELQEKLTPKSSPTVTRGTKAEPWSGNDAPTSTRSGRGEMVRGRSID